MYIYIYICLAKSRVRTQNLRRANFRLFKELLDEILWETILRDLGSEQSWQLFKDSFLREQASPSLSIRDQVEESGNQHD